MFRKFKSIIFIIILLTLWFVIYVYKLDKIPSGLYVDEAVSGYNSYSILLTGKDEYGKFMPIAFRFFGSYTPPLFTYLTTIPIKILGLSIFSVRIISSLSSLGMSLIIYKFLREYIDFRKSADKSIIPQIGALLFLITPWSIFYGRIGYEIYLGFFMYSIAMYLFYKSLDKGKYLIWGSIFAALSTYSSFNEKYLFPIFITSYLILFRKQIFNKQNSKYILNSFFIFLILEIPNIMLVPTLSFTSKAGLFDKAFIESQAGKIVIIPKYLAFSLAFIREFFALYISYFSPKNLFFLPDSNLQRSIPELSVFYTWMAIPYFFGLYYFIKDRKQIINKFVLLLLVIAPIAASLTFDPFTTQRSMNLLLPLILIITVGLHKIIGNRYILYIFLFLVSLLYLWRSYFILLPYERSTSWNYGYAKLSEEIAKRPNNHFVIDQSRNPPIYIELLFFQRYDPIKFQKEVNQIINEDYYNNTKFSDSLNFSNIETRNIHWTDDIYNDQILVGDEFAISQNQVTEHFLTKEFEIVDPMGKIVFVGYKTHPKEKCTDDPNNVNCK